MASAMINARTDDKLKAEASELFHNLGMDMTTAINIFLRAAVKSKSIPFAVVEEPDEEYKAKIKRTIEDRLKRSKDPSTEWFSLEEVEEMLGL